MQEDAALGPTTNSSSATSSSPVTDQRPVSALGWGMALAGGALLWAGLIAALWR